MAAGNVWRDSAIVMAIVVVSAYAAAVMSSLLAGAVPPDQVTVQLVLAVVLVLVVLGLGFVLWRSAADRRGHVLP